MNLSRRGRALIAARLLEEEAAGMDELGPEWLRSIIDLLEEIVDQSPSPSGTKPPTCG